MEVSLRLLTEHPRRRVAILVSKEPHCLDALIRERDRGTIPAEYVTVISNHEALRPLAEEHGLPFVWQPSTDKAAHFRFVAEQLTAAQPDLVVLARYMQVLPPEIVTRYPSGSSAPHPSLLPLPGANAYCKSARSVRVSGCTAHFDRALDQGPSTEQVRLIDEVGLGSLEMEVWR
jgi:formyltetrahydrofolate deformylase